jgi:hypothetical protein
VVLARFLGLVSQRHPGLRVLKASAEDIESKTPYYPWKQIFATLVGVDVGSKARPLPSSVVVQGGRGLTGRGGGQTTQFTHRACVNALASLMGGDFEKSSVLNDVPPHAPLPSTAPVGSRTGPADGRGF